MVPVLPKLNGKTLKSKNRSHRFAQMDILLDRFYSHTSICSLSHTGSDVTFFYFFFWVTCCILYLPVRVHACLCAVNVHSYMPTSSGFVLFLEQLYSLTICVSCCSQNGHRSHAAKLARKVREQMNHSRKRERER